MFDYLGSSDLRALNLNGDKTSHQYFQSPESNIIDTLRVWKSFDLVKAVTIPYYLYYLL